MSIVHFVLPNDIDDPATPSGGNSYDRRVATGLAELGWSVREHAVRGTWPHPSDDEQAGLARVLAAVPDDAVVLIDGLVASAVPSIVGPESVRLRLVVLVHMALDNDLEREVLHAVDRIVTTSQWSRNRLLARYGLPGAKVRVAAPGVDAAPLAPGSPRGTELLCVAAVSVHKGHDVLLRALATIADRPWRCVCVGSLDRDPAFVRRMRQQAQADGIADRVSFVGALTRDELTARYAGADLAVLATRAETYGMVVTEALARGLPVVASSVGGVPEALGTVAEGRPGRLVAPEDPAALAEALGTWLDDAELRQHLRGRAADRRTTLTGWEVTAAHVSRVLGGLPAKARAGR